ESDGDLYNGSVGWTTWCLPGVFRAVGPRASRYATQRERLYNSATSMMIRRRKLYTFIRPSAEDG
ncbi:MAG: hypothetical protein Q7R41_06710, partial [Phycisphaerales bacterium]|nr:hypothetical protein [Phycisphaerales bacterium]